MWLSAKPKPVAVQLCINSSVEPKVVPVPLIWTGQARRGLTRRQPPNRSRTRTRSLREKNHSFQAGYALPDTHGFTAVTAPPAQFCETRSSSARLRCWAASRFRHFVISIMASICSRIRLAITVGDSASMLI